MSFDTLNITKGELHGTELFIDDKFFNMVGCTNSLIKIQGKMLEN
jgi:hypothetical protein